MSIPPVSDEDLAQLVLGYLHDEELMTVYDEFLSASPHLDSHKNEYKSIWMKSLHSIVSEFGAIKINVEKCMPLSLRKRLRQCPNLIEIFKFLVMNVDIKKIPPYTATSHRNSVPETVSSNDKLKDNNMDTSILTETIALSDLPDLPQTDKTIRPNSEENANNILPINSTSHNIQTKPEETSKLENQVIRLTNSNEYLITFSNTKNFRLVSTRVNNVNVANNTNNIYKVGPDSKVTILSDIKVDKNNVCKKKEEKPSAIDKTIARPLQTIVVDGTAAYKPEQRKSIFTRDEIMAMPALIVVSAPGPPPVSTSTVVSKCTTPATRVTMSSDGTTPSSLKPLVIDISDSPVTNPLQGNQNMPLLSASTQDISLIKTVDHKNIPTPRFFDSPGHGYPKPINNVATPSSYSSRPTDYSSGRSRPVRKCEKPVQESDAENLPLRWSDDGSQDAKSKDAENLSGSEIEVIPHIKAYIEQTLLKEDDKTMQNDLNSLHIDLVKRGFDVETAKSIETDLLDINPQTTLNSVQPTIVTKDTLDINLKNIEEIKSKEIPLIEVSKTTSNLETIDLDSDIDEVQLSIHECNAGDYITCVYDNDNLVYDEPKKRSHKIQDNFTMEFCMYDGVILLKTTPFTNLFNEMPRVYDFAETEADVSSISNFESLCSPDKTSIQKKCREISDLSLTSLDSPLKPNSPNEEVSVSEIVMEVEQIDTKKRKRVSGSCSEEILESKRSKRESRLLPNIQNMDIESMLRKLHGP